MAAITGKICARCFNGMIFILILQCVVPTYLQKLANEPLETNDPTVHGSILSPLLKALSDHEPWPDLSQRTKPESRHVQYMKRLYKMSTKPEKSHETNHLYNTVRLITPREECSEQNDEGFMQDFSYSLNRVRSQEHLLKSVLLYSLDQAKAGPSSALCYLDMEEHEPISRHCCPGRHFSVAFPVRSERPGRRQKWVEVNVTSFLHPLFGSHKRNIHLLLNLSCVEDGNGWQAGLRGAPVELALKPPSLLLYLNDISELAHQRWPSNPSLSGRLRPPRLFYPHYKRGFQSPVPFVSKSNNRRRRTVSKGKGPKPTPAPGLDVLLPEQDYLDDDCHLYEIKVTFSQLKMDHWIIAPHGYKPMYCKGACPRQAGYMSGSSLHTMVQNLIYEKLGSSVPRPSCVPSEYSPLSVLIIEKDGSIVYKEYEEMVATKCSCR